MNSPTPCYREGDDAYAFVTATLDDQWRVIESADGVQWVLQRRAGGPWLSELFFRTSAALKREADRRVPGAAASLSELPEWFPESERVSARKLERRARREKGLEPAAEPVEAAG